MKACINIKLIYLRTYKTKAIPDAPLVTSLRPGVQNQRLQEIEVRFPSDTELAADVVNPAGKTK